MIKAISLLLVMIVLFLMGGCGSKHKVNGKVEIDPKPISVAPVQVEIVPNFRDASNLCDERYGIDTEESDACFEEILNFFDSTVTINDFCQDQYESEEDIQDCRDDLVKVCKGKKC